MSGIKPLPTFRGPSSLLLVSHSVAITGHGLGYGWDDLDPLSHQILLMGTEMISETSVTLIK
jgi:hypothetical protein